MTKVFISQPMKDKTEQEILEERANIFQLAKESFPDAELIDSYFDDYEPSTDLLAHAMKSLATYSAMKESEGWGETSERHSYSRDDGYSGRSYADGYTQGYRDAQHSGHYPMMPEYAYHNGRNW